MHLEQQVKDSTNTFPNSKRTHRKLEKLAWGPSALYSPSVALVVNLNPTCMVRLVPTSINTKQESDCNIQMPIHLNQLNQRNMKHIHQLIIHDMKDRNINIYICG